MESCNNLFNYKQKKKNCFESFRRCPEVCGIEDLISGPIYLIHFD